MMELLLGDEAVGIAAIDAGIAGAFSYPGTPATEILEFIHRRTVKEGKVAARWSANEKVAYEEALGMSFIGKRSLVSMKHVGLNVAADPFMSSGLTGAHGALVIAVADDPGMHSSQNEQDTRYYADFAKIPVFEPSNQQEAYDMTREAFELSEKLGLPVMIRLVTRLAHSRANVLRGELEHRPGLDPVDRLPRPTQPHATGEPGRLAESREESPNRDPLRSGDRLPTGERGHVDANGVGLRGGAFLTPPRNGTQRATLAVNPEVEIGAIRCGTEQRTRHIVGGHAEHYVLPVTATDRNIVRNGNPREADNLIMGNGGVGKRRRRIKPAKKHRGPGHRRDQAHQRFPHPCRLVHQFRLLCRVRSSEATLREPV